MTHPQICLLVRAWTDPSDPGMGYVGLVSPRPASPGMFLLTPPCIWVGGGGNKVPLVLVSLSPGIHKIPKLKAWQRGQRRSLRKRTRASKKECQRRQRPNDNENISKT